LRAYIIVDLGFGDAGKGLLTDYLVRRYDAGLVIRYNGGAQAGHNVVTASGHHHTFSQFGSGTFIPRVKTYLSKNVVIHPTALLLEGDKLEKKGVQDPFSRIHISDQALVITPFHQAANRIRELVRGEERHGSCGVGVGEAVEDSLSDSLISIRAIELNDSQLLRRKLIALREQKREQFTAIYGEIASKAAREFEVFDRNDVIDSWISSISRINELKLVVSDSVLEQWCRETDNIIFEGAQGVLLDEEFGFHPFTTWSRCTTMNALELVNEFIPDSNIVRIGLMRSYAVRHGPGPLPTETEGLKDAVLEHNNFNAWQGGIRYGWFDMVMARYALEATKGVDTLMISHLDVLPRLVNWKYCIGYREYHDPFGMSIAYKGLVSNIRLPSDISLEERAGFTKVISSVKPVIETCSPDKDAVLQKIELLLGYPVGIVSQGPSADHVQVLKPFPD